MKDESVRGDTEVWERAEGLINLREEEMKTRLPKEFELWAY